MTCNWARGKRRGFSHGAAARQRGRTRAPVDGASNEMSLFHFPLEIGGVRRAMSNGMSALDVLLHIRPLPPPSCLHLSSSCLHLSSQIRRLPKRDTERPISNRTLKIEVRSWRRPISKKCENEGKKSPLKSVGPLMRPLWRAAGSGAKAPPLAARAGFLWVLATLCGIEHLLWSIWHRVDGERP